jgi:hypothetical protein
MENRVEKFINDIESGMLPITKKVFNWSLAITLISFPVCGYINHYPQHASEFYFRLPLYMTFYTILFTFIVHLRERKFKKDLNLLLTHKESLFKVFDNFVKLINLLLNSNNTNLPIYIKDQLLEMENRFNSLKKSIDWSERHLKEYIKEPKDDDPNPMNIKSEESKIIQKRFKSDIKKFKKEKSQKKPYDSSMPMIPSPPDDEERQKTESRCDGRA